MKRAVFYPAIAIHMSCYFHIYFFGYYDDSLKAIRIMNELFAKT